MTFQQAKERKEKLLAVYQLEVRIGDPVAIAASLASFRLARLDFYKLSGKKSQKGRNRRRRANTKRRVAGEKA
jgi:hypothetical protein